MSADNRLCLMRVPYAWAVWNGSGSMDYYEPSPSAREFDTEAEARAYMATREDDYFEYGHQTIGADEQRVALTDMIAHLQARLDRLNSTGSQWPEDQS